MEKSSKVFVGMDLHKESIDITLAEQGGEVHRLGTIGGDRISLLKMVSKQRSRGRELVFVYEAGPCGFWIYREITALVPRRAGDRVKTDRRDSERLASLARAGELEAIHVPDIRDEAIRDLVRGRDDAVIAQRRARQQLKTLLLRNDIRYVGKTSWTGAHRHWLSELKLPEPAQQIAFEEYIDAIAVATGRIERLTWAIEAGGHRLVHRPGGAGIAGDARHPVRACRDPGGRTRRPHTLWLGSSADGISGPGPAGGLLRGASPPGLDHQCGQQLRAACADRGGLGVPACGAGHAHHRHPANGITESRLRHRLACAAAPECQVPAPEGNPLAHSRHKTW